MSVDCEGLREGRKPFKLTSLASLKSAKSRLSQYQQDSYAVHLDHIPPTHGQHCRFVSLAHHCKSSLADQAFAFVGAIRT